ncbi:MAG: class I SAM-dependent methyltransferase [Lachnospiraceae bacterium]|nr:class I SAM-dependent methyltransferase [Lachnospiraceae bacterium]
MKKPNAVWNFYAPVYNVFMRSNRKAYEKMYKRIRKVIKGRKVLELATGTGLIARHVADTAREMVATDFSENMLRQARKGEVPANLSFQMEDATDLSFGDHEFDVVIISNALHIIPNPDKVLLEVARVLKPGGVFIAPNFIHDKGGLSSGMMSKLLVAAGITFEAKWDENGYRDFLRENGWEVKNDKVLDAMIPLMYTECISYRGF